MGSTWAAETQVLKGSKAEKEETALYSGGSCCPPIVLSLLRSRFCTRNARDLAWYSEGTQMPLSSAEISQLNGAFTQSNMLRMQYSGMISPEYNFGGMNHRMGQENLAAKSLNAVTAFGAPMAGLGMGLMGLDPMSMGVRAGAGAMGAGAGFAGGALTGLAVGGGMMAGLAGVSYMANQVTSGMQQTQQFNNGMRGSYSFLNPASSTGRGFSEGGIREIGNTVRGMAGGRIGGSFGGTMDQFQEGPGFNELGRLAANMGRMGLADGVRNVKEFKEKFSEMLKTVTQIATDMGSSLEEAQKAMASMKGSGIFNRQGSVSNAIRSASISGGLATTEVTGMMNVGSQISRMFGGTGRQGAMGGIEAISQVGTAVQQGVLSEEDIYQATGQTGAEGRRAMAQQQLLQTGSFLKSGKGRYLLASLAGKNGKLDASSVADFMSGGMGVDDTRAAAQRNLGKVGRANFIRNEGRLRGAVMEEFGGLAPAMAMMGWAQGKGIDINSMGDREMLFMQRQMGMGRDEADALVKMARKMPELLQARRNAREDDAGIQEHQMRERNSGLEGVKRKLEAARDNVNNEMQKVGQDILNSATDKVAAWGNRLAGTYEEHAISGIREASRAASLGGTRGRELMQGLTGGKFIRDLGGRGLGDMEGPHENVSQRNYANRVNDLQFASRLGAMGGMSSDLQALVGRNSSALKQAYGDELAGLTGEDRMSAFKRKFGKDTELGKRYRAMDAREQAAFMQQMEGEIGLKSGRLSETFQKMGPTELIGGGEFHTEAERQEALGRSMLGMRKAGEGALGRVGDALGGGLGSIAGPLGGVLGSVVGKKLGRWGSSLTDRFSGDTDMARAAGAFLDDPEMRRISNDVLSGADGSRDRLNSAVMNIKGQAAEKGGIEKLTAEDRGKLGMLQQVQLTADVMKAANAKGGLEHMSNTDWDVLVKQRKRTARELGQDPDSVTKDSILREAQGVQGAALAQRKEIVAQLAKQAGAGSRGDMQALVAGGVAKLVSSRNGDVLELSGEGAKAMAKAGGAAAQAAQMALEAQNLGMRAGRASSPEEQADLLNKKQELDGKLQDLMGSMDVKHLKAFGAQMAGTSVGGQASELIMRGSALTASTRKFGAAGAIASQLGLQLGADEMAALKGKSAEAGAAALAARLGVGDDKGFTAGLQEAIAAASKKGGGIQGAQLLNRALGQADDSTRKKLEEMAKGEASPEEKIVDKISEGNKFLEALVKSNDAASRKLAEIASNTNGPKDGEAPK